MTATHTSIVNRLRQLGLTAGLAALAVGAVSVTAAQAAVVRIGGVSTEVAPGGTAFVDSVVSRGTYCRLEATRGNARRHSRTARARHSRLQFSWTVPADAASGPFAVKVRCAHSKRSVRKGKAAKVMITVAGAGDGAGFLFGPKDVRIESRGARSGERVGNGMPDGVGDPNSVTAEVPPGTGGAAYGTFWPLRTGTSAQITQGPGGGVSHAKPTTRYAVDLGIPPGTEIRAGFSGVVARVSGTCRPGDRLCGGRFGNYVLLKGADGTCSLQAHLSRVDVSPGLQVAKYALLGLSGYTGYVEPAGAAGAHLHYDRVDCNTFNSLPWGPAEGGPLAQGRTVTSGNAADPQCPALQGGCSNPQGSTGNPQETGNPQGSTSNPQPQSGEGGGGAPPPPPPASSGGCSGAAPNGPAAAGFHIQDIYLGGTWARNDPCNGTWHSKGNRPANGAYWYSNGLGVGVNCARTGAAYVVKFADGRSETWATWFHVTDGKWFPSGAAQETTRDGFYGLPAC